MADRDLQGQQDKEQERQDTGREHEVNTDFMQEKIKARPVNKKKLLRRTVFTACMAVLFGALACIVFLVLEPVISKALNPEEPQTVTIPEETQDEISPEDMIASDEARQKQETEEAVNQAVSQIGIDTNSVKQEIKSELEEELQKELSSSGSTGSDSYDTLSGVALGVQKSMVTVAGITPDYDWAGDAYNRTGRASGLIVAVTAGNVIILTPSSAVSSAQTIQVTFPDGSNAQGRIRSVDEITGTCVLAVARRSLSDDALSCLEAAEFGSSRRTDLLGKMVIAAGAPTGSAGGIAYGVVTNAQLPLDVADSSLNQITTDIYGSTKASGALFDTDGKVIGWIDMSHNTSDSPNLVNAIGITELKPLIERMSNAESMATLGLHGTDIPDEVQEEDGMPEGAYVMRVEMDSPALEAGLQSGDIVTAVGDTKVISWSELVSATAALEPEKETSLTIMRQTSGGYKEAQLQITPAQRLGTGENR